MANFDNDDPLADLLSDGSNDSFFEEPKVLAKRASLTKTPDKKSVADIFGLNDDDNTKNVLPSAEKKTESDWLGIDADIPLNSSKQSEMNITKSPIKMTKPVKKISFEDDDFLGSIGLGNKADASDTNKNKTESAFGSAKLESSKKAALLESLLGPPKSPTKNVSFDNILEDKKEAKTPINAVITTASLTQSNYTFSSEPSRESRRSRPSSSALPDPLGLFSNESIKHGEDTKDELQNRPQTSKDAKKTNFGAGEGGVGEMEVIFTSKTKDLTTKSTPNITSLPDWLGKDQLIKTNKSESALKNETKVTQKETEQLENPNEQKDFIFNSLQNQSFSLDSLLSQQKLATSNIEYQNTSFALQQQESQLLIALQLKKYEENLTAMQQKQQEILYKQEQQFNSLLERQFAKQQIMENNMRLQQERINHHIQMLLSQPTIAGNVEIGKSQAKLESLKVLKSDENSRMYEELISNLKQHQQEEMFLLEETYKKQILILEQNTELLESRLKNENESLMATYESKIKTMNDSHKEEVLKYKQKIEDLTNQHREEMTLIRNNHDRVVEEIKYEYNTMVENIKQTRRSESNLFENSSEYANKLDTNLKILDINSRALVELHTKVENDFSMLGTAREETLKAKEEEIRLMRTAMEKSREAIETERVQLLGLVRSLEMKIVEQNQNAREDKWALQQAVATFVAKSSALDREAEFNRASLEREREHLKTLKEAILAEKEQMMLQLNEEKLSLSAEKARMETSLKLNQNFDLQKAKAEVEASIQVAKEAANLTDKERENLHRQQCEVESLKRTLLDREKKISIKEKQMDSMFQSAEEKSREGEEALREAKILETKCNEKFNDIQKQLLSLSRREKKLAEEKIALSKERLALNTLLRENRKCGLCAVENATQSENENRHIEMMELNYPRIITAVDPDLMRLQLEINENGQNISERLEEN